jgi:hypothetical protein
MAVVEFFHFYHPDLIMHLQRLASQYLELQCLHLDFTLGDIGVAYLNCVTSVWTLIKKMLNYGNCNLKSDESVSVLQKQFEIYFCITFHVRVIKSRKTKWEGHVACMEEMGNAYKIFNKESEHSGSTKGGIFLDQLTDYYLLIHVVSYETEDYGKSGSQCIQNLSQIDCHA